MALIRLHSDSDPRFAPLFSLYQSSFPLHEQRRLHDQLAALDDKPHVSQRGHIVAVVCERPDVRFDHAHTATPRSTSPTATATPSTGLKDRSR